MFGLLASISIRHPPQIYIDKHLEAIANKTKILKNTKNNIKYAKKKRKNADKFSWQSEKN